jgi:biopolymer transport protein ExbD
MQIQDEKPYDEINITPMLDLAYVLLVIFILMCTATVQGMKAGLPRGSNAPKSGKQMKIQAINVNSQNKITLNKEELTLPQLEARLAQAKAENPKVQVVVKGESATQYQSVIGVLNVINQLGIRQVGLITSSASAK